MIDNSTITIETPSRSARARVVRADGEVLLTTSVDVLKAIKLEDGDAAPPAVVRDQIARSEPAVTLERALKILDYRERSVADLRERLKRDGFSESSIEPVIERLVDLELVNDERFAELYVRTKIAAGWGNRRIAEGLRRAGISDETAVAAAQTTDADEAEFARALAFAVRKHPSSRDDASRVANALARRGFGFDIARRAAREALESSVDED